MFGPSMKKIIQKQRLDKGKIREPISKRVDERFDYYGQEGLIFPTS